MKKILFALVAIVTAVFTAKADTEPSFPGGEEALNKFITENTRYPQVAKDNGVEGIVLVGFIVNADGTLNNIKVIKFVDPDLETEAVRVVKIMPAWIPAEKDGTPIEAPSKVEIPFILEE